MLSELNSLTTIYSTEADNSAETQLRLFNKMYKKLPREDVYHLDMVKNFTDKKEEFSMKTLAN